MNEAIFIRLLTEDLDEKSDMLETVVVKINVGDFSEKVFTLPDRLFSQIPRSPFAYWAPQSFRELFTKFLTANDYALIGVGASTKNDFKYLRLWFEVLPQSIAMQREQTTHGKRWITFAKGGAYSPFYSDVYLVLDWLDDGKILKEEISEYRGSRGWGYHWTAELKKHEHYLRAGLTWPRRTQKGLNLRAMPAGCIFADKGPAIFVDGDEEWTLLSLLGVTNSTPFKMLVELQMAFGSYEVGVIQRTPIPGSFGDKLAPLARQAHDFQRENYIHDETTHVFQLPGLVDWRGDSLAASSLTLEELADQRQEKLAQVQVQIDDIVFDLYGLDTADRQLVMREMGMAAASDEPVAEDDDSEEDEPALSDDLPARLQNLLMWCVGVAFGRWDVRKALDRSLIPDLPEPFDPLPRCAPGTLMNADGLPAERTDLLNDYPLPIAWDGVLVDDPEQENMPESRDIVARVRGVLTLLWGNNADGIEREICAVLNIRDLRDYFRNPTKGFFGFHIKRYSKSRRKAPICWLLQSEKRNLAVWLYYPRINVNTLFTAENIIHDQLRREQFRLNELKDGLEAFSGADRKRRERDIDAQTRLVEEIATFHRALLRLANLRLPPDHNDGVLVSIAPLHELVPWKEAGKMWDKLKQGDYTWSSMSEQMRQRGLINV